MSRYRDDVQCSSEAASGSLGPSRIESRSGFDPSPTPTFELGLRGPGFSSRDAKRRDETGRGGAEPRRRNSTPARPIAIVAAWRNPGRGAGRGPQGYRSIAAATPTPRHSTRCGQGRGVRGRGWKAEGLRGGQAGRPQPQPQPPRSALVRFPREPDSGRRSVARRGPQWPGRAAPDTWTIAGRSSRRGWGGQLSRPGGSRSWCGPEDTQDTGRSRGAPRQAPAKPRSYPACLLPTLAPAGAGLGRRGGRQTCAKGRGNPRPAPGQYFQRQTQA